MTTPVRTVSIVSIVLLVAALALALVASTGASADETPDRPGNDRGWMMADDTDRPMLGRGEWTGRQGAPDTDRMREHHGTMMGDEQMRERHGTMMGDEQMRERHREMHGPDERPGPMDDAARERMREGCDHGDGLERTRQRANPSRMPAS